jgi:hypothetical protein
MTRDIYELCAIAQRQINRLGEEGDIDLEDGYKQFEVKVNNFQGKIIATVQWPSWRLDLCSFAIDDEALPHTISVTDSTYVIKNEQGDEVLLSKNNNSDRSRDWENMEKAPLWMVLDCFLRGEWTPPWRCGFCRDRIKGISRPKW